MERKKCVDDGGAWISPGFYLKSVKFGGRMPLSRQRAIKEPILLENWSVTNFKSIPKTRVIKPDGTETGTLDLKPLTVFCGANSSGKSSLLQSILLIAQTMRHRDREFPIVLNGDYTRLGTFDDVKTTGSETGEIGIRFTYKPESNSILYKNEYPFNYIWPGEGKSRSKESFEEWKEKLHKEAEEIEDEDGGGIVAKPYRNKEWYDNPENKFLIDTISFELFFSPSDAKGKTKILPALTRAVFSAMFYQQKKKDEYSYENDTEKGASVLKWNISESKGKECYGIKETIELPDGTVTDIRREKEFFPFEITGHEDFRFQGKLPDQYTLEINAINCILNHFFPEKINHVICSEYLDFLYLLFCLGCYDSREIRKKIRDEFKRRIWEELSRLGNLLRLEQESRDYLTRPEEFDSLDNILIPDSIYEYIKNHILQGIEDAEDLLGSFEFNDDGLEINFGHVPGLNEDELLDIDVDPHYYDDDKDDFDGPPPVGYIAYSGFFLDGFNWKYSLDKLDNAKKELIYKRLYDDKNRMAIFARYMFWRWEVDLESLSSPGEDPCDDASGFITNNLSNIFDWFSKSIYYLGPLREDPKALYPYPDNDDSFDLGRKGEHTASVLFLHGEEENNFPLPDQKEGKVKTIDAVKQWLTYIGVADDIEIKITEKIKGAIRQWLSHIGVADTINDYIEDAITEYIEADIGAEITKKIAGKITETKDVSLSGIVLNIKTPGSSKWSDLTNVGVGVSQVIPIVVMCLTAKKGTTLVIEQPELHLHPKMQTKLAEFFMAIANSGVQCVIETHSEHFISAMRLNIASAPLGQEEMIDKSIIYFVEKVQNSSMFREIKINDLGIIPHWPKDFFDEGINQTDSIILASSKKRTRKFHDEEESKDE